MIGVDGMKPRSCVYLTALVVECQLVMPVEFESTPLVLETC